MNLCGNFSMFCLCVATMLLQSLSVVQFVGGNRTYGLSQILNTTSIELLTVFLTFLGYFFDFVDSPTFLTLKQRLNHLFLMRISYIDLDTVES